MVLKFEPPNARVLNFPKNSALSLIRLDLINGDCVYRTSLCNKREVWNKQGGWADVFLHQKREEEEANNKLLHGKVRRRVQNLGN